jgi:hypothetical protein
VRARERSRILAEEKLRQLSNRLGERRRTRSPPVGLRRRFCRAAARTAERSSSKPRNNSCSRSSSVCNLPGWAHSRECRKRREAEAVGPPSPTRPRSGSALSSAYPTFSTEGPARRPYPRSRRFRSSPGSASFGSMRNPRRDDAASRQNDRRPQFFYQFDNHAQPRGVNSRALINIKWRRLFRRRPLCRL